MISKRTTRSLSFMVVLLITASIVFSVSGCSAAGNLSAQLNRTTLSLVRPPFISNVRAAPDFDISVLLDQEAGISAWLHSAFPIDLTNAATAFRVIEDQTSHYIIGSVALPNYDESFDAHVYVHTDGWILAYYLRQDPESKIIAIKEININTTNLASIVGIVAGAAGVPTTGINYYDFRYPSAKSILLVYENEENGNNFTINMPSSFAYYERGWALIDNSCCSSGFWLDGNKLASTYGSNPWYGVISAAQMPYDVTHTIAVDSDGVLIVTYTEPLP